MLTVATFVTLAAYGAASGVRLSVDCDNGSDDGKGTASRPYRTVPRAQAALRLLRTSTGVATISITGLCELPGTLEVGPADSNTLYLGEPGAILSGGTQITVPKIGDGHAVVDVDLKKYVCSYSLFQISPPQRRDMP